MESRQWKTVFGRGYIGLEVIWIPRRAMALVVSRRSLTAEARVRRSVSKICISFVALLIRIREVPGSNLDPETGFPNSVAWFFSVTPGKCRDSTLN
jgi:hypothetical protein